MSLICVTSGSAVAADVKVACVGDSITAGSGASTAAANYPAVLGTLLGTGWNVRNFGNSGKTMIKNPSDGASYWIQTEFTQSQSFQPDIVVIMLGTNDSKTNNWKSGNNTYAADYKSMVAIYLGLASKPKVYAMFPPPALSSQYNISATVIQNEIIPIIKSVASQTGIETLDLNTAFSANNPTAMMGTDGIHPNDKGYRFIAQFVADALKVAPVDAGVSDGPVFDGWSSDLAQPADAVGNTDARDSGLGGTTGTGGLGSGGVGSGGISGTGGVVGSGGTPASGGTNSTGGTVGIGGATATGGTTGSGGSGGGGAAGSMPAGTGGGGSGVVPNGNSNAGCGCNFSSSGASSETTLLLVGIIFGLRRRGRRQF